MKRIVLTPVIEGYANEFLNDLKSLADKPLDKLINLRDQITQQNQQYYNYVNTIIQHYDEIITAKPDDISTTIAGYFSQWTTLNKAVVFQINTTQVGAAPKQVKKKFYQLVTDALGYDDVQEQVFPKYIKKMGIKSCVYCNGQYAISAKRSKTERGKKYRSTFTIDHYLPKSDYPYLATSFFNLYPACATCNQAKSSKPPLFELYINPLDPIERRNPFLFNLDKGSFVKYSMSGNSDDLEIKFGTRSGIPPQEAIDYENYFHVGKLYGNLKDTVEEVIWKYRVYNKAGRKALYDSYGQLLPHKSDWNRFVLGNYDKEEDILRRPLAKLVQDVAKQLGII